MNRLLRGLSRSAARDEIADGVYLVRVQRAQYRWHKSKPFYDLKFYVLEPAAVKGGAIATRIYCSPKNLWKFAWFLRDFRYSPELLESDEIDMRLLLGLKGVIEVKQQITGGQSEITLKAFAPEQDWERLAPIDASKPSVA